MEKIYRTPPYKFCPFCKGNLTQEDPFRQKCMECDFIMYHNSSPCAGAVPVDKNNRVLLAKRGIEPFKHGWNIIGGFLNYGENPMDGLKREVKEETGVDCEVTGLICMYADTYGKNGPALINMCFTVQLLSDNIQPLDDVAELKWFELNNLPNNIPFESDLKALNELKKLLNNRNRS
jgi:8-oxo-dGTP diphosphatase